MLEQCLNISCDYYEYRPLSIYRCVQFVGCVPIFTGSTGSTANVVPIYATVNLQSSVVLIWHHRFCRHFLLSLLRFTRWGICSRNMAASRNITVPKHVWCPTWLEEVCLIDADNNTNYNIFVSSEDAKRAQKGKKK